MQPPTICIAGGILLAFIIASCGERKHPGLADQQVELKRGKLISCGRMEENFGNVSFAVTAPPELRDRFNTGVALLHSFEYDEAEKVFASIIDDAPDCAMAYWGVAIWKMARPNIR